MNNLLKYLIIIIVAYWMSDFTSGLFHIYADNRRIDMCKNMETNHKKRWQKLVHSFQYSHHHSPHDIIKNSYSFLNPAGQGWLWIFWLINQVTLYILIIHYNISLPISYIISQNIAFVLMYLWAEEMLSCICLYGFTLLLTTIIAIIFRNDYISLHLFMQIYLFFGNTSQIYHLLAHMVTRRQQGKINNNIIEPNYNIIKFLQRYRLIIRPEDHSIHHETENKNFAIVNGWSNGVLNILFKYVIVPLMKRYPDTFTIN